MKNWILEKKQTLLLGLAMVLAFILRYYQLDFQSLWLDEIYTMNMADPDNSLADIYQLSQNTDALSFLYFSLLHGTFKFISFTPLMARLFSSLFGVAAVYFIFLLGSELRNKRTGIIAAFLLVINYFHIYYSQEARVYSMYMAFACLSFLHLLKFLKNPNKKTAVYYGVFSMLMLLSHFFSLFVLVSQLAILCLWCFYKKNNLKKIIIHSFISYGIVLLGFLAVMPIFLTLTKVKSTWIPPLSDKVFAEMYSSFFGDSFLIIVFSSIILLYFLFKMFNTKNKPSSEQSDPLVYLLFLLPWIFVCFFIPYIKSFLEFPIFQARYLISILPALMLMLAIGFDLIISKEMKWSLLALFMMISFNEIYIVKNYAHTKYKTDFRGAAQFLMHHNYDNSVVVTTLSYHFNYYFKSDKCKFEVLGVSVNDLIESMKADSSKIRPFWAIDAHGRNFELTESNKTYLNAHFEEFLSFQSIDAWAKHFIPKVKKDTTNVLVQLNALNFFDATKKEGDQNIYMYEDGQIQSRALYLEAGKYLINIKALSSPCFDDSLQNAHVKLFINNRELTSYFLSKTSILKGDTIAITITKPEELKFKIEYDNDIINDKFDRNLTIREISILK